MQPIEQLTVNENNIAFHPMMGNSYQLNDISSEIVHLLKLHKTKDEIIDELLSRYDVSKSELFIDVSDFISKMKVYGLL